MKTLDFSPAQAKLSPAPQTRKLNPAAAWFLEMDHNGRGRYQHDFWKNVSDQDKMRYASELIRWKRISVVHEFARFAPKDIQEFVLGSNVRRKKLGLPAIDMSKSWNGAEGRMG